jgi:hypothetical protein
MHKNPVWISFLTLVCLVTLYFTYNASKKIFEYQKLSHLREAHVVQWKINPTGADYELYMFFYLDGEKTMREQVLLSPKFRNEWAAKKYLLELQKQPKHKVWTDAVGKKIVFNRQFPWKQSIYAIVLVFITGYFLWLGAHVRNILGGK